MPPTHPSQAAVAAAYRTLIAHETEPKEQDFYRTRLQRLEQATEPECEFDCRSRVAAAGVGVYCPQCSAKCADTDLATELAKAIRAAWVDRLDWDELAHAALKFLTAAGRLIPAGGMALTAEELTDVQILVASAHKSGIGANAADRLQGKFGSVTLGSDSNSHHRAFGSVSGPGSAPTEPGPEVFSLTAEQVEDVRTYIDCAAKCGVGSDNGVAARLRALFPATEPAEPAIQSADGDCFEVCEGHPVETPDIAGTPIELTLGTDEITEPWSQTQFAAMSEVGDRVFEIDWDRGGTEEALDCIVGGRLVTRDVHYGAWRLVDSPDPDPASAEPAEEETKAEEELVAHRDSKGDIYVGHALVAFKHRSYEQIMRWYHEAHPGGISERRYRAVLHLLNVEASSPVVPAPAETGPWQTWQEVPEGVWFLTNQNIGCWMRRDGDKVTTVTGGWPVCTDSLVAQAPFVAAEEG